MLICGGAIAMPSMDIRHGFGPWLQPVTQAQNGARETFALAIGIQNIGWGMASVLAGVMGLINLK